MNAKEFIKSNEKRIMRRVSNMSFCKYKSNFGDEKTTVFTWAINSSTELILMILSLFQVIIP